MPHADPPLAVPVVPTWPELPTARLADLGLPPPLAIDGALDLATACRQLADSGCTLALVHDNGRVGLINATALGSVLRLAPALGQRTTAEVAQFDLAQLPLRAGLSEALQTLTDSGHDHALVRDGDAIAAILTGSDLATHALLRPDMLGPAIDRAGSVTELRATSQRLDALIGQLQRSGTRSDTLAEIACRFADRLLARLWTLLAPADLVANSCLLVMGSEGRHEQILKTDQDNALLLRDGFECSELASVAQRFNEALSAFGYPQCPGGIMLTNPQWRQPLAEFKVTVQRWLYGETQDGVLQLAIFLDARTVCGDRTLLTSARAHLQAIASVSDALMMRFVAAIDMSDTPPLWWTRLTHLHRDEPVLDIKRLGTFPIVHGVRALALEHGLHECSTVERLQVLVQRGQFDKNLARDLCDALHFFMQLKLQRGLQRQSLGLEADNLVDPATLGSMDKEQLHQALAIVKRLRQHLRLHFRMEGP